MEQNEGREGLLDEQREPVVGRETAPPPESPPLTPSLPHVIGVETLRADSAFCDAWADWKRHLAELGKDMTRQQEGAVLTDCVRNGPHRSAEIIRYSIAKGAKNLIGDAPRASGTRRKGDGAPEPDPDGYKRWFEEEFPDRPYIAFSDARDSVKGAFRARRK